MKDLILYAQQRYPEHAVEPTTVGTLRRHYGEIVDVDAEDLADEAAAVVLSGYRASHKYGVEVAFPAHVNPQHVADDYVATVCSDEGIRSTVHFDVCVWRLALAHDANGDPCTIHIYNEWHVGRRDPQGPTFCRRNSHRWLSMRGTALGSDYDCCVYCGWLRRTVKTSHGGITFEKISYKEPTRGTLAWARRHCDRCGQRMSDKAIELGWPYVDRGSLLCPQCYEKDKGQDTTRCAACRGLLGRAVAEQRLRYCLECLPKIVEAKSASKEAEAHA